MRDLTKLRDGNPGRLPRRMESPPHWKGSDRGHESEAGRFYVASCVDRRDMIVVATSGDSWDHVSVSRGDRVPHWSEMEQVKRTFFEDDETAMQIHVPPGDHVNRHPRCLHLWRPLDQEIPRPPAEFVG